MALFKITRGSEKNLPETATEGYAYFCVDSGNFFIDIATGSDLLNCRKQLNAKGASALIKQTSDGEIIYIDADDIATLDDLTLTLEDYLTKTDADEIYLKIEDAGDLESYIKKSDINIPSGVAGLDSDGKLDPDVIPDNSIGVSGPEGNLVSIGPSNDFADSGISKNQVIFADSEGEMGQPVPVDAKTLDKRPIDDFVLKESIINNLETNFADRPLSAQQGKILQDTKEDKLILDEEPTHESKNYLNSNAVYEAFEKHTQEIRDMIYDTDDLQVAKNVLGILGPDMENATLSDALIRISFGVEKKVFGLTVQLENGTILPNIKIVGVDAATGGEAITNKDGYVMVVSDQSNPEISIKSPYIDIDNYSGNLTDTGDIINNITIVMTKKSNNYHNFTSTETIKFSNQVNNIDICCVGGGGGGASSGAIYYTSDGGWYISGGGGGGGGFCENLLSKPIEYDHEYLITVGAGGSSDSDGGASSFGELLTAQGGIHGVTANDPETLPTGGNGNGIGGRGLYFDDAIMENSPTQGGNGTVYEFNDSSRTLYSGAGGGGGGIGNGGQTYGGQGAALSTSYVAEAGKGPGGGGGGGYTDNRNTVKPGGAGHNGCVAIRWR